MKPYIILIFLVVLVFANSIHNSFVWDDYDLIVNNPKIDLSLREIPSIFFQPQWKIVGLADYRQDYYRPVGYLFWVINYKIWGLNPSGFHLTNIALHLLCSIILYRIGLMLFNNEKVLSLVGASIFAVYPVHNEPVGKAASGEVIFGFLVILSLYLFLKEKRYASWITFFLALLSKEAAVVLPFGLAILVYRRNNYRQWVAKIAPYFGLVGIYLILRMLILDTIFGGTIVEQPLFTRVLTMAAATMDYIRLLIIPYPMSPFYPAKWYTGIIEAKGITAPVFLILLAVIAFRLRKDRELFFLLIFTLLILAPVIWRVNTFPVGWDHVYIAERFLYVPAMSFSLFVSASVYKLVYDKQKTYFMVFGVLLIVIFSVITVNSNKMWKDNLTLFKKIVEESPDVGFAHNNLGNAYMLGSKYFEAISEYRKAIALDKRNIEAYYNLGISMDKVGLLNQAVYYYEFFYKNAPVQYNEQKKIARERIDVFYNEMRRGK